MDNNLIIIIVSVIVSLILLFCFSVLFLYFKKKNQKNTISEAFIDSLLLALGSKSNIVDVQVEQGRLKILVNDLELVNLDQIKALTDSGVFVTGNYIKVLFREDSEQVKKALTK